MDRGSRSVGIRIRLGVALALALLPVLLLGIVQSAIAFNREAAERRQNLIAAAQRSAAAAQVRLNGAAVLLDAISPSTVGVECAPRLAQLMARTEGFANLVRLDALGRVRCAAGSVTGGGERRSQPWFQQLAAGRPAVFDAAPMGLASRPAVLAAARATDAQGRFDGASLALIDVDALCPVLDRTAPPAAEAALIDARGRILTQTASGAFNTPPPGWAAKAQNGGWLFRGSDQSGERRIFSVAPLLEDDVFVLLSAPAPSAFSWARLNLLSGVVFPLLAFALALMAVWIVTENVIIRWLHYLERIAAIYARGRFTIRPVQAERAPPEIRELASTLDQMADTIVGRDLSLRESIAQKDGLMREIHHRVKNNLQVITSLLNMQQRALADPSARVAMIDTRQRINALALIYRHLYQGPDLKKVDFASFLEELIAQLISSDPEAGVRTELEADELIIDPDQLAPVALFAVEAITNAQKHAFAGRGGTLRVRFSVGADEARLEIADDSGSADAASAGEGVGRTLMNAFARQLRGRLEFEANGWGGLTVALAFPTPGASNTPLARRTVELKGNRNQAAA
ncbi:MAG TPA: sensor histidine kinase [Caulobacteraceae bacterium]